LPILLWKFNGVQEVGAGGMGRPLMPQVRGMNGAPGQPTSQKRDVGHTLLRSV
jgi:hypothetical protein